MERLVLVADLKPGARDRALELIEEFAAAAEREPVGEREGVFVSDRDVVFFFEGPDVEVSVREILNDPVRSTILSPWLPLFDGPLHTARESYFIEHGDG